MGRFFSSRLLLIIPVMMLLTVIQGYAAETSPLNVGGSDSSFLVGGWSASYFFNWLPSSSIHTSQGNLTMTDNRLRISKKMKLSDNVMLFMGAGYGHKHLDTSPGAMLPADLHGVFLEAGAGYQFGRQAFVHLRVFPGFYSDFKDIGHNDVRMPTILLAGYNFSDTLNVVAGGGYRFGYHSANFIPAVGVSYRPTENIAIDLVAPMPKISYSPNKTWSLFVAGDLASDEYQLHDSTTGANVIKYSDYKVLGGFTFSPLKGLKGTLAGGIALDRQMRFYDGNRANFKMDSSPFIRTGIEVDW